VKNVDITGDKMYCLSDLSSCFSVVSCVAELILLTVLIICLELGSALSGVLRYK